MKLARGSYANVTATLALLVALGGTSYAAVEIAKNSVGTPQLKANAVTAKKVKDGSLLSRDFKAGQLPGGPQGPAGAAGAAGAIGPNGPVGATGQQGLVGARGPAGTEGAHGDQGLQGEKGDTGDQGIQGAQGDTGEKGDQGDRGVQGAQGDKGEKGDPGPAGPLLTMLPSGKTLVGHWGVHEQDVNNTASSSISYFAPLASNPQSEIVAFGDGPTENCPGLGRGTLGRGRLPLCLRGHQHRRAGDRDHRKRRQRRRPPLRGAGRGSGQWHRDHRGHLGCHGTLRLSAPGSRSTC